MSGSPQCCSVANFSKPDPLHVCLPHANLVGFRKCGTTALHGALLVHPGLYEGATKELDIRWRLMPTQSWDHALDRFRPRIPPSVPGALLLNSDGLAFLDLPGLAAAVPNARVIFILRDPIARTLSALRHSYRQTLSREQRLASGTTVPRHALEASVEQFLKRASRGSICLTSATAPADALATMVAASRIKSGEPVPPCLRGRVTPCHYANAVRGEGAELAWAVRAPGIRKHVPGGIFYLPSIIEVRYTIC